MSDINPPQLASGNSISPYQLDLHHLAVRHAWNVIFQYINKFQYHKVYTNLLTYNRCFMGVQLSLFFCSQIQKTAPKMYVNHIRVHVVLLCETCHYCNSHPITELQRPTLPFLPPCCYLQL